MNVYPYLGILLPCLLSSAALAQSWPSPDARGLTDASGLLHVHSPFSHDACDDNPLDASGAPQPWCLADLREDICDVPHRFYFLTDHRTHMAEQTFEALFHHDATAGDRWVLDDQGQIVANEVTCARNGQSWSTFVMVGLEGSHNLLLGLNDHLDDPSLYGVGFGNETALESQLQAIDAIHAKGGLAMLAHGEEDDVPPEQLLALPIDGLELYNAHSNLTTLFETRPLKLLGLEAWLLGADDAPTSDYLALLMFPNRATEPMHRWDAVTPIKRLNGVIGTDVHENVSLPDAYCSMRPLEGICARVGQYLPNTVSYLEEGGPVLLGDGERLDSYQRMFRWFSNHALLRDVSPDSIKAALASGRSFITYDILGTPEGFDFVGTLDDGTALEMGDERPWEPGITLHVKLPTLALVDNRGETWTPEELAQAEITARLLRVDASGTGAVAELVESAPTLSFEVPEAGVYRVEVYIRPTHLAPKLGSQSQLSQRTFDWIWSNPIYLR